MPAEAVERLLPVRSRSYRIGGSHAQRDLVQLTAVGAALASGNGRLARALAAERTEQKPASPLNWRLTARALEAQGAAVEARQGERARGIAAPRADEPSCRLRGLRPVECNREENVR